MPLLMMALDKIHGINGKYVSKAGDIAIRAAADIIRSGDIAERIREFREKTNRGSFFARSRVEVYG